MALVTTGDIWWTQQGPSFARFTYDDAALNLRSVSWVNQSGQDLQFSLTDSAGATDVQVMPQTSLAGATFTLSPPQRARFTYAMHPTAGILVPTFSWEFIGPAPTRRA